jgi:tRNA(Arg) A34 adenosine deaminase TadA
MATNQDRAYMRQAIEVMREAGLVRKTGGAFGAVIVKDGRVVAASGNRVVADRDPTAHAEVCAIRMACATLGTNDLSGAVMYTSCMCCPMCYAASYWARIDKVFYAAGCDDYADVYDDAAIYKDLELPMHDRKLKPEELCRAEANLVWDEFRKLPDGARY